MLVKVTITAFVVFEIVVGFDVVVGFEVIVVFEVVVGFEVVVVFEAALLVVLFGPQLKIQLPSGLTSQKFERVPH